MINTILIIVLLWLLYLMIGCAPSATSQRASQQAEQSTSQDAALSAGLTHSTHSSDRSIPIIINCIQVDTGRVQGDRGSCISRQGSLPIDGELIK